LKFVSAYSLVGIKVSPEMPPQTPFLKKLIEDPVMPAQETGSFRVLRPGRTSRPSAVTVGTVKIVDNAGAKAKKPELPCPIFLSC